MAEKYQIGVYSHDQIVSAIQSSENNAEAARKLGVSRSSLYGYRRRNGLIGSLKCGDGQQKESNELSPDGVDPDIIMIETEKEVSVRYVGEEWLTAKQIAERVDLDMDIWAVDRVEQKGYEVTGKIHQGQVTDPESGTPLWKPQTLWKSCNRYVAVRFVRRAPKNIQDCLANLAKRVKWPQSPSPPKPEPGDHVMELSVYDLHLGKYCWGKITGTPYDNVIASQVFADATHDLLGKTNHFGNIREIICPVGHDFFQVDNWLGETAAGTRVDSSDDRFTKTFESGVESFRHCINACLQRCPVKLIYVPGNHDPSTSYYLCKVLEAMYEDNPHVTVDTNRQTNHGSRKYLRFGVSFLGYVHGSGRDCPRDDKLPLLMATEEPMQFAQTLDRAWRLGHLHTKRTSIVPIGDIFNGVRVERIPSLSGTDLWHYNNGFTGNRRSAEAWVWSYKDGLSGQFPSYIQEQE